MKWQSLEFNFTPRTRRDHALNAVYMAGFGVGIVLGMPAYAAMQTWHLARGDYYTAPERGRPDGLPAPRAALAREKAA